MNNTNATSVQLPNYGPSLDYSKATPLFEWAFAVFVANFTLQVYHLVGQLATLIFDMFKLAYSKEIFGQLTNDEIKPHAHYLASKYEIAFRLGESAALTLAGYFIIKSLLNSSAVGLVICMIVFAVHCIALTIGAIYNIGK
jgi:hypothetical protein